MYECTVAVQKQVQHKLTKQLLLMETSIKLLIKLKLMMHSTLFFGSLKMVSLDVINSNSCQQQNGLHFSFVLAMHHFVRPIFNSPSNYILFIYLSSVWIMAAKCSIQWNLFIVSYYMLHRCYSKMLETETRRNNGAGECKITANPTGIIYWCLFTYTIICCVQSTGEYT